MDGSFRSNGNGRKPNSNYTLPASMVDIEYVEAKIYNAMHYRDYYLNIDKINSIDDCKKILKFLCDLTIKPTPEGIYYNGFEDVEEYFEE